MCDFIKSVLASLVAAVVYAVSMRIGGRFSVKLNKRGPRITSGLYYSLFIVWGVFGISVYLYVIFINRSFIWLIPSHLVWSFFILLYLTIRRNQFRDVGIYGADREIKTGIDYQKSLLLINNKFKFLGIGAGKLTDQRDAFKKAIKNCIQDKSVKFLLCKPTHEMLLKAAKRFEKPINEYKDNVIRSLRYISELKQKYENIEVRFYKGFQIFRMMFIDDSICLLSYNVMGEGDGSQLPQLLIVKQTKRVVNSLYYPLERYFDDLWKVSEKWDFKKYL